ncbi:MAG: aminotransferase class V-fold PLP-dependent enzyme [Planctomycetota bacterium]
MNAPLSDCRADFPVLLTEDRPAYLDSAATSLRPRCVSDAVRWYMEQGTAAVHRGMHKQSIEATERYERTRTLLARWIGADSDEIVFTSGSTAAINLVRYGLKEVDGVAATVMEHHSNLIPWMGLEGFKLIPVDSRGTVDTDAIDKALQSGVKLIAVTHMSNVLGCVNPIADLAEKAHQHGAKILVDAAQSASHHPIDVRTWDVDFLVCSSHKMLGPAGVGALYVHRRNHEAMRPVTLGGNMVDRVRKDGWDPLPPPHCFEAGSPPAESVIGWGAALEYLEGLGRESISSHLDNLTRHLVGQLQSIDGVEILGPPSSTDRGPLASFVMDGLESHATAKMLNRRDNIIVRSGFHCAEPLHEHLGVSPTLRASLQVYNNEEDIDRFATTLRHLGKLRSL